MSPKTRSDSLKKKVQNRVAYSRSAKRSLENDFEATTSEVQPELKKVAKRVAKTNNKTVSMKAQKRKRFNVGIHTPKITKKAKDSEHVIVSDDDFQSNQFIQKRKKRSGIKIGIGRGKFPRETLVVKKVSVYNIDAVAMHAFIFESLYEYLGSAHLILIPLTHKRKFHYTLLTFDAVTKCFYHYNSMSSRQSRSEECLKEAAVMVAMLNMWMSGVEIQADIMLESGMRKKLNRGECSNVALQMDRDALNERELLTIKWVKENYKTDFKLYDKKDLVPKQAFGSLDCGVYVMHYMDDFAYERYPCDTFDETATMAFRVDLIKRFARSSQCWRAAS